MIDDDDPLRKAAVLFETIEEALAPYADMHPPETLAIMRREMIEVLATHPYTRALLKGLMEDRMRRIHSGPQPVGEGEQEDDAPTTGRRSAS
jgi:hypothetical protein